MAGCISIMVEAQWERAWQRSKDRGQHDRTKDRADLDTRQQDRDRPRQDNVDRSSPHRRKG
jgi:hypothetical protein